MSKTLKVKFMMEDFWGRKVYRNIENGHIYKDVDGVMHTSTSFGEPHSPLLNKIEVVE